MRQPREGEVFWRTVPGGRARHAITRDSWPNSVCGIESPRGWYVRYSFQEKHKHRQCDKLVGPGRINFWPPDYDEE